MMKVGNGIPGPLVMPTRGSDGAACYDVVATRIEEIEPGKVEVFLGFATEIEPGFKGCIVPRSSFTHKGWVMQNSPAQIDPDYRGEWKIKFEAIPNYSQELGGPLAYPIFPYKVGERVAQIYFEPIQSVDLTLVFKGLDETKRGDKGFGSTGNKII